MMSSDWYLMSDNPTLGVRRWGLDLDDKQTIVRTEYYAANSFFESNATEFKETEGQRFGEWRKVASTPMHIAAREILPRLQDGNETSLKKWLNSSDHSAFRTFKGSI